MTKEQPYILHHGDCLEVLRGMADCSVDSIVTDPPYGLSFMGRKWDYDVPSVEIWTECLRVLKPGGHLLSFAGTRTQHRMCVRIEDAGFEIRDMIAWVYGSGFPKSLDVSKAIDKLDATEARIARRYQFTEWMVTACALTPRQMDEVCGTNTMGRHWTDVRPNGNQPDVPTRCHFEALRPHIAAEVPAWVEQMVDERTVESENFKLREVVEIREMRDTSEVRIAVTACAAEYDTSARRRVAITAPTTDAAKQWQGWGTALKPALEPITMARKPLAGTVAANVTTHGTGGLNIDGCRVGMSADDSAYIAERIGGFNATKSIGGNGAYSGGETMDRAAAYDASKGRWPANLIHSGETDAIAGLGEAARYFYCAKASRMDRGEANVHPTVKPTALMRYLCRLVTPPGGVVFDPFTGSGSTGKAAVLEGFRFIGAEREAEYVDIARARIEAAAQP